MPLVSIVMPTFNRADTIARAIASIQAQTHANWELVVVDDGSTDDTVARVRGLDPRVHVLRQDNQGVTAARNTGLGAVNGDLVAFLDSDDEWLPHHLALATAFFRAFPDEHLFTSEFWEDFGTGEYVKHYRPEVGVFAPQVARRIGSGAFDVPAPQGDPYLRFYETRAPIGSWGSAVLGKTRFADALHYRGNIFRGWRWEFLMSMQSTVLTRAALARVGLPDPRYRIASDYAWLAQLCRAYATNMVSAPGTIKHEFSHGKTPLAEGHLVTGRTATQFHQDMLAIFEDLFWREVPEDPELQGIRAYRHLKIAEAMLAAGRRRPALAHLDKAAARYRSLDADGLRWLARLVAHDGLSARAYRLSRRAVSLPRRALRRLGHEAPPSRTVDAEPGSVGIEVKVVRSPGELAALGPKLNQLNLVSRRPCPFASAEYLSAVLAHDEDASPGDELLCLLAFEGERLVGYLPLRKTTMRLLGIPHGRIECLALGYRDRPHVVARVEDEAACAAAFYRTLKEREPGWAMIELTSQDSESTLDALVGHAGHGFWARRYETDPNATIPLPFASLADYYRTLDGNFRRKVTARCRKLLSAGTVEAVISSDPAARAPLLDLYLDVERRSWKAGVRAGIARHPERVALVRALCASPLSVVLLIVLLDGVPIAGLFAIEFEKTWYVLETGYASAYSDLAPGYLLHVLGIGEAIARGQRAFNLLHAYAYYKLPWKAVAVPTAAVQIYRVPSLPYLKAQAGELRRLASRTATPEQFNPARRAAGEEGAAKADGPRLPCEDATLRAAAAFTELRRAGGQVKSLSGPALLASLPFSLESSPLRDASKVPRG
jgi:CelD/BcsL family acetyltransferase involved in cellulose biosynthesis